MTGGGDKKFGPCVVVSLYGDRRVAWNTLWILHMGGSQRWYMSGDRICAISKGPCCLGTASWKGNGDRDSWPLAIPYLLLSMG